MTDREKLVELINKGVEIHTDGYQRKIASAESIADHLLANGVAVQQWISVKDRLPEAHEFALVYYGNSYGCIMEAMEWTGEFWRDSNRQAEMDGFITHWMPLPEPLKEETLEFDLCGNCAEILWDLFKKLKEEES